MKEVSIICLDLKQCAESQRTAIQRGLSGYIDYSNKGAYKYKRKGILDEISHLRLNKGVIVVEPKNKKRVTTLLKKNNATYKILNLYSSKQVLH
jgi:hypothetical protein